MQIWPDLGNPAPREPPQPSHPIVWPLGKRLLLDNVASSLSCTAEVEQFLRTRRSERQIGAISDADLGAWLDLSCRAQLLQGSIYGFDISLRPAPSAGAIHPIHLVFTASDASSWRRYDGADHALIDVPSALDPREVHRAMQQVLAVPNATLILLAAEVGKTAAKYHHPASLVWRDAGALLAVMGLAAHALALAFCPLGVTGEPWVGRLLEQQGLFGVGAAFVGARATTR
ncbi:nitroreductase family protein [Variovorax ureilyticus]|uniref:nitroreductase family protein n=1 Tax=Variovorax ureilyticus TaxID=1836198 RepID=UPI003D66A00D